MRKGVTLSEISHSPLSLERLRWRCTPEDVSDARALIEAREQGNPGEHTSLHPLYFTQGRALSSLHLGVKMEGPGYHVFVAGPPSTGKSSTVKALLRAVERPPRARYDYAYVNQFEDADRPTLIQLPVGEGRRLKRCVARFIEQTPTIIHSALASEQVERKRRELNDALLALREEGLSELQELCAQEGFALIRTGEDLNSIEVAPLRRKKPMHIEEWVQEVARGKIKTPDPDLMLAKHANLEVELNQLWEHISMSEWEAKQLLSEVELSEVINALRYSLKMLDPYFVMLPKEDPTQTIESQGHTQEDEGEPVHSGAKQEEHQSATETIDLEREAQERQLEEDTLGAGPLSAWVTGFLKWIEEHIEELKEYKTSKDEPIDLRDVRVLQVNLIHEAELETPVIFEQSPTLINLLGTIERSGEDTHPHLDFGDIRGGSLLKANGGILVVNANDMSHDAGVWRVLLRALRSRTLEIQSPDQLFSSGGGPLKPEPIPLDVKIIALGDDELFRALYVSNEDFGRVFKIKVEFDDSLPNSTESLSLYIAHADRVIREESLPIFSDEALCLWAEFGTRLSGHQGRLSTYLGALTDLLREAAFYASEEGATAEASHMRRALKQRFERHQMIEDRLFQMFEDEAIELNPSGSAIGSAIGLTVMDFGDHACGQPCKISASVSPGEAGVVSVEREVELSGRLHDKGALTLSAYLRARYLPDQICALHATLCFDQLHDEIEGDSASLAEAVALISELSEVPVAQHIAMTGALDIRGRVQAIGGINEKIEGFYRLCKLKGLSGDQGVIIPKTNTRDLALRQELIDAVEAGEFRLWAVEHIDEALAILSGPTEVDLHLGVSERLSALSEVARRFKQA